MHMDFTIIDIVCLQLAFIISYFIRLGLELPYSNEPYERLAVVLGHAAYLCRVLYGILQWILRRTTLGAAVGCCQLYHGFSWNAAVYVCDKTIGDLFEADVVRVLGIVHRV